MANNNISDGAASTNGAAKLAEAASNAAAKLAEAAAGNATAKPSETAGTGAIEPDRAAAIPAAKPGDAASDPASKIDEAADNTAAKIDAATRNATAKLDEAAINAAAKIDEAASNAAAKLGKATSDAAAKHVEVTNDTATKLDEVVRNAAAIFDGAARNAAAKHDETANNAAAKYVDAVNDLAAILDETTRNASAAHNEATSNAAAKLDEVTSKVTAKLDEATNTATAKLDETAKNAAAKPDDEIIDDAKKSRRKVKGLLHVGKRCMVHADLAKADELYKQGKIFYLNNDMINSSNNFDEAENEIIGKLNEGRSNKPLGISGEWIAFMVSAYGYIPLAISLAFGSIFAVLLITFYGDTSIAPMLLGVPLWATLFAGIGACIQIIMNLVADIRDDGVVSEHRQLWFAALPLIALVFGYLAYILIDLGITTLAGPQASLNTTALAATQPPLSVGMGPKILICFLAGYATDDFIKKLASTTTKI